MLGPAEEEVVVVEVVHGPGPFRSMAFKAVCGLVNLLDKDTG